MMQTILLVDDDREVLSYLEFTLASAGYNVIPKTDALTAMRVIKEESRIDLVITDYLMPGMDGHEFFREVKKALPLVPVIMLTGHASVENYVKSLGLGLYEYVCKPIESAVLHRIVKKALEKEDVQ